MAPAVMRQPHFCLNIWQGCKQERGCLMNFARLANTLLKDEESARDNHVLACTFDKNLIFTDLKKNSLARSAINLS